MLETASREAVKAGSHERQLMDGLVLDTASREAVTDTHWLHELVLVNVNGASW